MGLPLFGEGPFLYIKCGSDNDDEENKITLTRADRPPPSLDFIILNQEQKKKREEFALFPLFLFILKYANHLFNGDCAAGHDEIIDHLFQVNIRNGSTLVIIYRIYFLAFAS